MLPAQLLSPELGRHLSLLSHEIGRLVGVLINRAGHIEHVFVGDALRLYLPDVGRHRGGGGHLRGLRHVHTVFGPAALRDDDLADLAKLRLDLVCAIGVQDDGEPGRVAFAHLLPGAHAKARHHSESARSVHDITLDFAALIAALEAEQGRHTTLRKGTATTRAVLVGVYPDRGTADWRMAELDELAATAGVEVVDRVAQLRRQVDGKFLVGRGKLEEVTLRCLDLDAELIIIDHNLSPAQARAIAASTDLKVIDRTQLILDIFAQHAQSSDGKLQVELAQLKYNLPRLTDLDAGLSRLTGGIGGRGPGETKLEINRRRARDRITKLEKQIDGLSQQRHLRRQKRSKGSLPIVSIVGYTNAGKSTLLNALTHSDVLVADQLFATLDPTTRRLRFPKEREAIITDTVGFIRDLPADLIRAFRATLEELEAADLILHVVDAVDPMRSDKQAAVVKILEDLHLGAIPRLLVLNKCDLLDDFAARALARQHGAVAVSAQAGQGLDALVQRIASELWHIDLLPTGDAWAEPAAEGEATRAEPPAS